MNAEETRALEQAMRDSGLMARIEDSRAHPERMVPLDFCAVCGESSAGDCAACDRKLCEGCRRTTAVPGDSFCRPGEGCDEVRYG